MTLAGLAVALSATACGDPPPRPVPTTNATGPSKAELFGSASLVPTRAGERARAELALAAELDRVLEAMRAVDTADVAIRLPPTTFDSHASAPARALVTVALEPDADAASARIGIGRTARTWLGPQAELDVTVAEAAPIAEPTQERPSKLLMLAVALLGLGASLGVTVDRAFDRRRRKRRTPRS